MKVLDLKEYHRRYNDETCDNWHKFRGVSHVVSMQLLVFVFVVVVGHNSDLYRIEWKVVIIESAQNELIQYNMVGGDVL